jgi:hypothetical protein
MRLIAGLLSEFLGKTGGIQVFLIRHISRARALLSVVLTNTTYIGHSVSDAIPNVLVLGHILVLFSCFIVRRDLCTRMMMDKNSFYFPKLQFQRTK